MNNLLLKFNTQSGAALIHRLAEFIRLPASVRRFSNLVLDCKNDAEADAAMSNVSLYATEIIECHSWIMCTDALPSGLPNFDEESYQKFLVVCRPKNKEWGWSVASSTYEPSEPFWACNNGFSLPYSDAMEVLCWRAMPMMPQIPFNAE